MGRHPHTHYIRLKPKKSLQMVQDLGISTLTCALPSTACRSPKNRSNMTKDPQNLVMEQ
jgi:hypothetical protein